MLTIFQAQKNEIWSTRQAAAAVLAGETFSERTATRRLDLLNGVWYTTVISVRSNVRHNIQGSSDEKRVYRFENVNRGQENN
jgi:hypothetical protein